MPYSFDYFKQETKEFLIKMIPPNARILDVGAGNGTYARLIGENFEHLDALEIFVPYIEKYKLKEQYKKVYRGNITNFPIDFHDFFILGDVLEHLEVFEAQRIIKEITEAKKGCLVAVPYLMEQGIHEDNPAEIHIQSDLTHEIMLERYPELVLLFKNEYYGYYTNLAKVATGKLAKAYVLFGDESYLDLMEMCIKSIGYFSKIPVIAYLLNSDKQVSGASMTVKVTSTEVAANESRDKFINREDKNIYNFLILRPSIVMNALMQYADVVAYIDSDSIASKYCDSIFNMFPNYSEFPYFTEGTYDYLHINGRGGAESRSDLSTTLEHNACDLFGVNQYVREKYRQTGYFVAGQNCMDFLIEWDYMCRHPFILRDHMKYAPYHEETIMNVLLWKYNIQQGLPYIYINGLNDNVSFNGQAQFIGDWVRVPNKKEDLLFYHGEKDINTLQLFLDNQIKNQ